MSNRNDVAKFLVEEHDSSMDVEDGQGISPRSMVFKNQHIPGMAAVNEIMKKHATKKGAETAKETYQQVCKALLY